MHTVQSYCTVTVIVSFNQTPYPVVCPGGRLVYTCVGVIEPGGAVTWRRHNVQVNLQYNQTIKPFPDFNLNITSYNYDTMTAELVTTATSESASVQLDGSNIHCSDDGINFLTLTIDIAGKIQ